MPVFNANYRHAFHPKHLHPKRLTLLQVRHQPLNITHKLPQHPLLLLRRPLDPHVFILPWALGRCPLPWYLRTGGRSDLRHEVEVQKLQNLQLHFTGRITAFKKRGNGREAIKGFKRLLRLALATPDEQGEDYSSVSRIIQQPAHQRQQRRALHRSTIPRIEKIQQNLHHLR